jgi:peptide deformylase
VASYDWIEFEAFDLKGEKMTGRLDGFAAVIFQHEFRHLLGGTYLDYAHHLVEKEELDRKIEAGVLPFFESASDTLPLLIDNYQIGESLTQYYQRVH